jgi:hypothetical protein
MKKMIFILLISPSICFSQQNMQSILKAKSERKLNTEDGKRERLFKDSLQEKNESLQEKIPVFSIFGLANLNQETLKGFNAGGKASVVARPLIINIKDSTKIKVKALALYASFNKSASNNDSVVYSKLIFPELGSSSFIGTLQWEKYNFCANGKTHSTAIFLEMAVKSIQTDSSEKGRKLFFDALNYTIGFKYGYHYQRDNPFETDKKVNLGFYVAPFISAYNIPDEDRDDYKKIMLKNATITGNADDLSDFIVNLGIKMGFHFNGMEFFTDLRHVLGDKKVPIRELRGFHANIGFVFNADVLNFY